MLPDCDVGLFSCCTTWAVRIINTTVNTLCNHGNQRSNGRDLLGLLNWTPALPSAELSWQASCIEFFLAFSVVQHASPWNLALLGCDSLPNHVPTCLMLQRCQRFTFWLSQDSVAVREKSLVMTPDQWKCSLFHSWGTQNCDDHLTYTKSWKIIAQYNSCHFHPGLLCPCQKTGVSTGQRACFERTGSQTVAIPLTNAFFETHQPCKHGPCHIGTSGNNEVAGKYQKMKTPLCPVKKRIYQAARKELSKYTKVTKFQSSIYLSIDPFMNRFMHGGRASWTPRAARHSVIGPESTQQMFHQQILGGVFFWRVSWISPGLSVLLLIKTKRVKYGWNHENTVWKWSFPLGLCKLYSNTDCNCQSIPLQDQLKPGHHFFTCLYRLETLQLRTKVLHVYHLFLNPYVFFLPLELWTVVTPNMRERTQRPNHCTTKPTNAGHTALGATKSKGDQ